MNMLKAINKETKNKERRHVSRCKNVYEILKIDKENNEDILKTAKKCLEDAYWQRSNTRIDKCWRIWFETAYDLNSLYTNKVIENNDQRVNVFDVTDDPNRVKNDFLKFFSNIA